METKSREEVILQRAMDFKNSLTGEHGARVLDYISKFCLEKSSTFIEDSERKSAFNEGARFVIIEIRRWVEYDTSKLNFEEQ